ncbi:hypothetical protein B0H14DRAFT_3511122 [Mycena olivaceomarginata]|nr:hypothetical protein B0H14DRAFT_3511122 [Mycena olivaceomarginata]
MSGAVGDDSTRPGQPGDSAFAHKAGVYDKFQGVVSDSSAQVFQPGDFELGLGRTREIVV